MKKVEEYRLRAAECRAKALCVPKEFQPHYRELAEMWDRLAEERVTFFVPSPLD